MRAELATMASNSGGSLYRCGMRRPARTLPQCRPGAETFLGGGAAHDTRVARLEPRILSILRIVVDLLYLEHGLNKLFDFPPTPTHVPYHVASVPDLAGPLEAVDGLPVALGRLFHGAYAEELFSAAQRRRPIAYPSILVAGGGSWSLYRLRAAGS